ncbi:cAMP phosphodiesterases class-II-domain-containing protein [Panaeolus papilionaceus]|nr:cAMP phosphodiesterases class-II-domain-containing protein [Panaeolus papilionaceus]
MHQASSKNTIAFDFVVVGAGGGPDETNLSAYLVKPHNTSWEDGIVALEAGSGQGTLAQLLRINPNIFSKPEVKDKRYTAPEIYSFVRCFLVTHAHLDHINSLIISAGSLKGARKRIYALKSVLKDIETVFSDRIWPNLASWKEEDEDYKLLYSTLAADGRYKRVCSDISVQSIPLNHGCNSLGQYTSTAFFVRHDPTSQEFIFFGDVEPDSLAHTPQTINVWRAAASKIPTRLSTIFIECSWPSGRKDELLFGHLTPEHLVNELIALATEVVKYRQTSVQTEGRRRPRKRQRKNSLTIADLANALDGVRVYVIHCKDDLDNTSSLPVRQVIVQQVRKLVEDKKLGAQVLAAEQGMHIEI